MGHNSKLLLVSQVGKYHKHSPKNLINFTLTWSKKKIKQVLSGKYYIKIPIPFALRDYQCFMIK